MNYIGGFFELEIKKKDFLYHKNAIALSYGRASLNLIIKILKPKKIYLPFYSCNSLVETIIESSVNYEFYQINFNFEINKDINLLNRELLLYINFFGLKNDYIYKNLLKKFNTNLIIDNTHDFFSKKYKNTFSFNSARKFFGVPDGSYLYTPEKINLENLDINKNNFINCNYLIERFLGNQKNAYNQYLKEESNISSKINFISDISNSLLSNINIEKIKKIRKKNFNLYHNKLKKINQLKINNSNKNNPFCYPLLLNKYFDKNELYLKNIFIPSLWNDVIERSNSEKYELEKYFSKNILFLPIDHRNTKKEIYFVLDNIL